MLLLAMATLQSLRWPSDSIIELNKLSNKEFGATLFKHCMKIKFDKPGLY